MSKPYVRTYWSLLTIISYLNIYYNIQMWASKYQYLQSRVFLKKSFFIHNFSLLSFYILKKYSLFRCAGFPDCDTVYPLKSNTHENRVTCPAEECGTDTKVYQRLQAIQNLKQRYEDARKTLLKGQIKYVLEGVVLLNNMLLEWEKLVYGDYVEKVLIKRDISLSLQYNQFLRVKFLCWKIINRLLCKDYCIVFIF